MTRDVVGLDLSLTATGYLVVKDGHTYPQLFKSKGAKDATLEQRHERLTDLTWRIVEHVNPASLVVIEQPAYSQTTGHHHDRSGLWWMVVDRLHQLGAEVVEVSPTTVKKYATGKGNATKDAVLAAVVKRYPDIDVTDNNVADATVLAAMGARHLGVPLEANVTIQMQAAMDAVRWPANRPEGQ